MPKGKTPKEKGIEKRELNKEINRLLNEQSTSIYVERKPFNIDFTFLRTKDMKKLKKVLEELG